MPQQLSDALASLRRRSGLHASSDSNAFDPTGNAQLAEYLNEAQHFFAREAVTCTMGTDPRKNKGWFLKFVQLSASNGEAWLPPDVECYIGDTDSTTFYNGLSNIDTRRLIGGCRNQWVVAGDRLIGPTSQTSVYILYNSNLRDHWVAGTVTSGSTTTFVASATPTYSTLPISDWDDYYNGLLVQVTSADGSQTQTARVTDYDGATRTFTVSSWPTFTPSSGDSWSTLNRLVDDDLLLYHAMSLTQQAPRWKFYENKYLEKREAWQDSVYSRHAYQQ